MDDIIVIILTLVVAFFGVLGQIRKKKQGQVNGNKGKSETDSFWNLFEEEPENMAEQNEEVEFNETQETVIDKPETIQSESLKYSFNAENEGSSIHDKDLEKSPKMKSIKQTKILKDFSLRKAVIYSEILNRKYN